ncbi:MAG: hypothetical protein RL220_1668, partial [Bacteroidota bacterium]
RVSPEEARDHVRASLRERYAQYGIPVEDAMLESLVERTFQNEEEVKNVYDLLFENKLVDVVKENCSIETKGLSYDEFLHMAQH